MVESAMLDAEDMAALLKLQVDTLRRARCRAQLEKAGCPAPIVLGRSLRWPREAVLRWINGERTAEPAAESEEAKWRRRLDEDLRGGGAA